MASFFDELFESSDSDDDNYVPDAVEISSDEDPLSSDDENPTKERNKKNGKKVFHSEVEEVKPIKESLSTENSKVDEKQRANDLFKSFLEEVEAEKIGETKETESASGSENTVLSTPEINSPDSGVKSGESSDKNTPDKPLCEIFDFAGEAVAVSVKDGTKIGFSAQNSDTDPESSKNPAENVPDKSGNELPVKRKGLQSVLGTIMNKNKKLSVLEKTSLDWKKFKTEHEISEELQTFNKGRGGFIERQRFLERSDVRSYEIERDMRMAKRKKNC